MKSIISLLALLATLYVNYLANALPLNGLTTGDISGMYDNAFVPAGLTFAIWGLIYLLLIGHVVLQLWYSLSGKKGAVREIIDQIQPWFWVSCLMNSLWIFTFHYQQWLLSILVMVVLLFSLLQIYTKAAPARLLHLSSTGFFIWAPFSVYFAWINVATLANATLVLVAYEVRLPFPEIWSVVLMTIAGLLAFFFLRKKRDILFAAVIVWALWGIHLGQADLPLVHNWALGELLVLSVVLVWQTVKILADTPKIKPL
jgi:hypothetical protein